MNADEASLVLPFLIEQKYQEITSKLASIHQKVAHVLVIGIGGSSLGAKSIMKFLGKKRK